MDSSPVLFFEESGTLIHSTATLLAVLDLTCEGEITCETEAGAYQVVCDGCDAIFGATVLVGTRVLCSQAHVNFQLTCCFLSVNTGKHGPKDTIN